MTDDSCKNEGAAARQPARLRTRPSAVLGGCSAKTVGRVFCNICSNSGTAQTVAGTRMLAAELGNTVCSAVFMNKSSPRTLNLLGHPVHQMLVVFPAGLLLSSVLVDVAGLLGVSGAPRLAQSLLGLGLLGGLAAAPFGWFDWRRIPLGTRARRVGAMHGIGNVVALLLFAAHWFMRNQGFPPTWAAFLSLLAGACMVGTAWLGAELVTRLGVGVHAGAHLDASNSLLAESAPNGRKPERERG